jgi:adenosine deaminase
MLLLLRIISLIAQNVFDTNTGQTDDVGVFGSSLSNEYALIAEHFGLKRDEISALAKGAIETIFGTEEDKEMLRGLVWK